MREENAQSARYTACLIAGQLKDFTISDDQEDDLERLSREHFKACEKAIKKAWEKEGVQEDGYILFQDNVYKAYRVNQRTIKITGPEAKEIKRVIKSLKTVSKRTCEA